VLGSAIHRPASGRPRYWLAALVLAGACVAVCPPVAIAVGSKTRTVRYQITVRRGVLATGRTVKATAVVSTSARALARWWSRPVVAKVVRTGVNGAHRKPYVTDGYRCLSRARATTTRFTCRWRQAGATVTLAFTARFSSRRLSATRDIPIIVVVAGAPAQLAVRVSFNNAAIVPFPSSLPAFVYFSASAACQLYYSPQAVIINAGPAPINATLKTAVGIASGATALEGFASFEASTGATVSLSVNGGATVPLHAGEPFSIPVS
jgi:hypothetical protein